MTDTTNIQDWADDNDAERIKLMRRERRLKLDITDLKADNRALHAELDSANERLRIALATNGDGPGATRPAPIKPRRRSSKGYESTAVALASDWHVYQLVEPDNVNGYNEYNPDIASARADKFFQNLLRLVELNRAGTTINDLVLWLGGDFIAGYIHDELVESNFGSPIEEIEFSMGKLSGGIDFLVEHGQFERICVITSFGNHGRLQEKKRVSTSAKNSLEWMLYRQLAKHYASSDVVDVTVSTSEMGYLDIYDFRYRFTHGDRISGGGGIPGITSPIRNSISKWNLTAPVYMTCLGHFHQLLFGTDFVCNGSLVGYDDYAMNVVKAPLEPARQAFFLNCKRRGRTVCAPIFVD